MNYWFNTAFLVYKVMYTSNCAGSIIFNYFRLNSEELTLIEQYLSAQILQLSSQSELLFTGEDVNSFLCWVRCYHFDGSY